MGPFGIDPSGVVGVLSAADLVNKTAIADQAIEVVGAAHQQRVLDGLLGMAVRALNRAVLVRDAPVVAGRVHAVMGAQRIVSPGQILTRIRSQISFSSRLSGVLTLIVAEHFRPLEA
jgi:hypothetical protein